MKLGGIVQFEQWIYIYIEEGLYQRFNLSSVWAWTWPWNGHK